MNEKLSNQLKNLPIAPGVYFHKDSSSNIIYVGKAANLKNRVRQYFHKSRNFDPKTESLVKEIDSIDWMEVSSEMEALFLEAEMIRRYMPKYNILLRDDKALSYVRINYDSDYPTVTTTRRPLDDGARYFGPFFSTISLRQALKILRRIFPYAVKKNSTQKRSSLYYHLGLDPGLEEGKTSLKDYKSNLRKLMSVISGKTQQIIKEVEKEMKSAAKNKDFEQAAILRNRLIALKSLDRQVIFSDKEFRDISKDHALGELVSLFNLNSFPKRIEGYDISHISGSDVAASMVVFTNGISDKTNYRKFKTRQNINNDFLNMSETIKRRFSDKNIKSWGLPSLILIDGGKGQLDAAIKSTSKTPATSIPIFGLAKKQEQIIIHKSKSNISLNSQAIKQLRGYLIESPNYLSLSLPHSTNLIKLLQRIRDESHRFAVSYHSVIRTKRNISSSLESIPGIGPSTRRKLIKSFGSLNNLKQATESDIEQVVGKSKAKLIKNNLI